MRNIKKVSQALKLVEELEKMNLPGGAKLKIDFDYIANPNEIEAICKQENGIFCPADKNVNYHFGVVKLANIEVTFKTKKC